jgi:hypothetical protein
MLHGDRAIHPVNHSAETPLRGATYHVHPVQAFVVPHRSRQPALLPPPRPGT